jgi:hypothetical protein
MEQLHPRRRIHRRFWGGQSCRKIQRSWGVRQDALLMLLETKLREVYKDRRIHLADFKIFLSPRNTGCSHDLT